MKRKPVAIDECPKCHKEGIDKTSGEDWDCQKGCCWDCSKELGF